MLLQDTPLAAARKEQEQKCGGTQQGRRWDRQHEADGSRTQVTQTAETGREVKERELEAKEASRFLAEAPGRQFCYLLN